MLGHASLAHLTVLAPKGRACHAGDAKVVLVIFPGPQQLINDGLLLSDAIELWHKPRLESHAGGVEVRRQPKEGYKGQVQQDVRRRVRTGSEGGGWEDHKQPIDPDEEQRSCKDASKPGLEKSAFIHTIRRGSSYSPSCGTPACSKAHTPKPDSQPTESRNPQTLREECPETRENAREP